MADATPEELERRIAWITGQVTVLGQAMQAVLKHHPNRDDVAVTLHDSYEQSLSRGLGQPFPEAFLDGMRLARDLYLLKQEEDPGQPSMKPPTHPS